MELQTAITKAGILIEALPYIKSFHNKFVVIKLGGRAIQDEVVLDQVIADVVFMQQVGMYPIVVHGGGYFINENMRKHKKEIKFKNGYRVTDKETLKIVKQSLEELAQRIKRKFEKWEANGIIMNDKDFIICRKYTLDNLDIGFVGEVIKIKKSNLTKVCRRGGIPIIYPIGNDIKGQLYNINADSLAVKVATTLRAKKLMFLSNIRGILLDINNPESVISTITITELINIKNKGIIKDGMIPKVEACIKAKKGGVDKIHIVDANIPHSLLLEIFTTEGIGTQVV